MLDPVPGAVPAARFVVEVVQLSMRCRVTGLSAEAAFFTLLSLPPLVLGVVASLGFVGRRLGQDTVQQVVGVVEEWAGAFLTAEVVAETITPTIEATLSGGRADLLSLGFLIALWSGSRALHVYIDAILIMYAQTGLRGLLGSRVMSLGLYVGAVLLAAVVLPLLLIGPTYLRRWLPDQLDPVVAAYWPVVGLFGMIGLTALYHFATPQRSPFFRDFPGAAFALLVWLGASVGLRAWAGVVVGGPSVFGPLAAPIIVLLWFYLLALAVLVGAGVNAAIRRLWPPPEYRGPVTRANDWWESRRGHGEEPPATLTPVEQPRS